MKTFVVYLAAVLVAASLGGCAGVSWTMTGVADEVDGYRKFIERYPDDPRSKQALERIEYLNYQEACNRDTAEAYQGYLKDYPQGRYVQGVKSRMKELKRRAIEPQARKTLQLMIE